MHESVFGDVHPPEAASHSALLRGTMVDRQVRTFEVTDQRLLARMLEVPRERFLPAELAPFAYSDLVLRLRPVASGGEARELLPPLVLARLIQGTGVDATDDVLDIAPGSGYSSAILAGLAGRVIALESSQTYYDALRSNLKSQGISNALAQLGPLAVGAPDEGPFDIILINGKVEANLEALFGQLKNGGRLVTIENVPGDCSGRAGKAVRYEKGSDGSAIGCRTLFDASASVVGEFKRAEQFAFS